MPSPASSRSSIDGGNEGNASPSARAAAEIIAITTRDDFLLEIGEALSGQSVRPVDSVQTALDQLGGNRRVTQLLAIDAREVEDLRAAVDTVQAQASYLVVLVFAESEKQAAAALKGANVFAVLPLPIDKRKTAAVMEGAVADAIARRPAQTARTPNNDIRLDRSASITVESAPADVGSYGATSESGSGGNKQMIFIGGGVAAVVVVAAAAWFFTREPAATSTAPSQKASVSISADAENMPEDSVVAEPTPVVDMQLINGTVDELLEKARGAMRERRYTEPNNDNALLFYRSAAKADPANGEAQDGLRRVAGVLSSRFDESMAAARYDEAALALAHLKAATPEDERVGTLDAKLATAQITKMLAENNLERAASLIKGAQQSGAVPDQQITRWRNEVSRRQDEAKQKRLVDLAQDRIRESRLSDGDDSAKNYAEQLKEMGSSANSSYQRVMRDLSAAYMRKAREAAAGNKGPEVDRWLAEARSAGVSTADINAFQRELANAKQKAAAAEFDRLAGLARDRLASGRLVEPTNDSAAFYLTSLQSQEPNHSFLATGSRDLASRLLDRANTAARENKTAQAEADIAQARKWGADQKDITAIQQAMAARKAAAPSRATSGAANAPTAAASSASGGSSGSAAPADLQTKLKRVRYQAPEYPERALTQKISGSVTVEFIVNAKGDPTDVRVVSAEPAGTFDRAALAAVKRWKYEPMIVDNVPTEVPARTTIRFALPSQ